MLFYIGEESFSAWSISNYHFGDESKLSEGGMLPLGTNKKVNLFFTLFAT
jgi:hypothetical protein